MTGLRQLLEWQRETPDTNEFLERVREDLFHDQVFVYTPKGDIVELAAGATPSTSPTRSTPTWDTASPAPRSTAS